MNLLIFIISKFQINISPPPLLEPEALLHVDLNDFIKCLKLFEDDDKNDCIRTHPGSNDKKIEKMEQNYTFLVMLD